MILLTSEIPAHTIAVFGVGLVGSALVERLETLGRNESSSLPLNWADPEQRDRHLAQIEERIERSRSAGGRVTFVWSAGRAGFGAGREETDLELVNFRAALALAVRCAARYRPGETRFVHFSSAGGLFEGQRQVGPRSVPRPRRPYGELKQSEERLLLATAIPSVIIRLSSVYGYLRHGHRAGLVAILLTRGIRRAVSSIVGTMTTLRDFVFVADVAAYVSRLILERTEGPHDRTVLLASGRPTSIFEVQKIIEDLLGYKISVSYEPNAWNRDDITFARSALPSDWVPSDLRTNVSIIYRQAVRSGFAVRDSGPDRG